MGVLRLLGILQLVSVALAVRTSFNLVSPDGSIQGAARVGNFISSQQSGVSDDANVVGVIDCSDGSYDAVNDLFGTALSTGKDGGISLSLMGDKAVLYGSFQEMFSPKLCGSKITDFMMNVCESVCVMLPGGDETLEAFANFDQIVRRIIAAAVQSKGGSVSVTLVVNGECSDGLRAELMSKVSSIFSETVESKAFSNLDDIVDLSVVGKGEGAKISQGTTAVSTLPEQLVKSWVDVGADVPKAILTAAERESLFLVEDAYSAGVAQSEGIINQWRSRVSEGKTLANFGVRVQALIDDVKKSFFAKTLGCNVVRERAERAQMLVMNIRSTAESLLKQQVIVLQAKTLDDFKKALVKNMRNGGGNDEDESALRVASYNFRTTVGDLENESLGLSANAAISEMISTLQTALKDFPESNQARLESLRQMDKKAKKPPRKKGRAVNIGLSLVGMLRPPGYGNLQGFAGYSTAAFGLPLDLLLGVQNDGDSPEIMGDDREYPILRLQPKMHFDIDV